MITIEEMQKKKRKWGYTYAYIALLSGLPVSTVQKVLGGKTKTPRIRTMRALASALDGDRDPDWYSEESLPPLYVAEGDPPYMASAAAQKLYHATEGGKTVADYLALPDDQRVELIDGIFFTMQAPTLTHQFLVKEIFHSLDSHVRKNKGPCNVFQAPLDVQLDRDDRTMVQPDILVICNRENYDRKRAYGAPDLVIEVLSKSTRGKDLTLKNSKYAKAGVREYWIVDPHNQRVIVYEFERDYLVSLYTFEDRVPVGIWGGACEVDFKEIRDEIFSRIGEDAFEEDEEKDAETL